MLSVFADVAPLTLALSLAFPLVLIAATFSDLRQFRIPNSYSLLLAGIYPFAAWSSNLTGQAIAVSLAIGFAVLVVGICLFALNLFGGGDVKLFAAASLWTGPRVLIDFAIYTAILGGLLALILLIFRKMPLEDRLPAGVLQLQHREKKDIPYALAIGLAGLFVFPRLPLFTQG
jgi:prepilin peptidase CpaA